MLATRVLSQYSRVPILSSVNRLSLLNKLYSSSSSDSSSSDSDSDSDNDKSRSKSKIETMKAYSTKSESNEKNNNLEELLLSMINPVKTSKSIDISVHKKKSHLKSDIVPETQETIYKKKVIKAAKDVAEVLSGNKVNTQTTLLSKLFPQGSNIVNESPDNNTFNTKLKETLGNMKIQRTKAKEDTEGSWKSKILKMKQRMGTQKGPSNISYPIPLNKPDINIKYQIVHGSPLGIFDLSKKTTTSTVVKLSTWDFLDQRELELNSERESRNIFQEMIKWTEEGKLWKFPIDNEQGMEAEQDVHFSEHVFLEKHLKGWCPVVGPIRHFMELVCVGISKNPYLTVEEKVEHIMWYKEFFMSKEELLKEIGAIQVENSPSQKQLGA